MVTKLGGDKPEDAGGKSAGESRFYLTILVYTASVYKVNIAVFSHPQALRKVTARRKTGVRRRSINRSESFVRNATKASTTDIS